MTARRGDEVLQVLACDIAARPAAPGLSELAPFVTSAAPHPDELTLEIDEAGRSIAEAFVAAEQVCCDTIGWHLEGQPGGLRLRITATPSQLEALAGLLTHHIERVQ